MIIPDGITKSASERFASTLCGVHPAKLGTEEAEMQIIGVDLHTRQQTVAMLNVETGEIVEKTLQHEADRCESFTRPLLDRVAWESKPLVRCSGSWS